MTLRKQLAAGALAGTFALGLLAAPADAKKPETTPANEGAACVQAGIAFLKDNGLFLAAAKNVSQQNIDYSALADPENGPIFADLPEGSYLSLGQVVSLHASNPELFAWC